MKIQPIIVGVFIIGGLGFIFISSRGGKLSGNNGAESLFCSITTSANKKIKVVVPDEITGNPTEREVPQPILVFGAKALPEKITASFDPSGDILVTNASGQDMVIQAGFDEKKCRPLFDPKSANLKASKSDLRNGSTITLKKPPKKHLFKIVPPND